MTKTEADKTFWLTLVTTILFIVFGIFLLFKPDSTITLISRFITVITSCIGIFGLFKYLLRKDKNKKIDINIIYGFIAFIIAIIVYIYPTLIANIMPVVIGGYMLVNIILKIGYLNHLSKCKVDDFGVSLLIYIIMVLLGIIAIINPLKEVLSINQTVGMLLVFYSVLDIILCSLFRNNIE